MLESLAFALVKTFISFMFEQHLENMQSVKIQGAPGWYYQQTEHHVCDSGVAFGTLQVLEDAKADARQHLLVRMQKALESAAHEKYRGRTDAAERALIAGFARDENLPAFIHGNVVYENLEYSEKKATAYARACIPEDTLSGYQSARMRQLARTVTHHRRDAAMDSLDAELQARP